MNLTTVVEILNTRLDELSQHMNGCFFGIEPSLNKYRETQRMIQACGHDTKEFQKAIQSATEALANLENARKTAVLKFKTEGVCFCVDGQKLKEIELASLQ
jgi:predicted nucleotide-binding protein (sugar kinase/HSP70/actin superfamily)